MSTLSTMPLPPRTLDAGNDDAEKQVSLEGSIPSAAPTAGDRPAAPAPMAPTPSSPRVGFVREVRPDGYHSPMTGYLTGGGVYRYFAMNLGRWKFRIGVVPALEEYHKRVHVVLPNLRARLPGIQVRVWRFAVAFAWENNPTEERP